MSKTVTRYSEAFKLKVVNDLEACKLSGINEARACYGIAGGGTIQSWLLKYGKNHLLSKVVRVETLTERHEIKRLKEEVKKFKTALADAHVDLVIERGFLKLACDKMGTSVEEYKKKVGTI